MRKIFLYVSIFFTVQSLAQDATVKKLKEESNKVIKKDVIDTSKKSWKKGGILSLNVTQGSLNNWAAGGDDFSLSANLYSNIFAFYAKGKNS